MIFQKKRTGTKFTLESARRAVICSEVRSAANPANFPISNVEVGLYGSAMVWTVAARRARPGPGCARATIYEFGTTLAARASRGAARAKGSNSVRAARDSMFARLEEKTVD